jgi:hypothetical protein
MKNFEGGINVYRKINANGEITKVNFLTLEEMQEYVGGCIENVDNMIYCRDGRELHLPRNKVFPEFLGNVIIEVKGGR